MSEWFKKLRPASFRGVPFGVLDASHDEGRRLVVHLFPQRDLPYIEDLGLTEGRYSINGFVLGLDAIEKRQKLIDACRAEGPGELIHPTFGSLKVYAERWPSVESKDTGRYIGFALQFVLAPDSVSPSVTTDTAAAVDESADAAKRQSLTSFNNDFGVSGQPDFVADDAMGGLMDIGSLTTGLVPGLVEQAGGLVGISPGDMANGLPLGGMIYGLIAGIGGSGANKSASMRSLGTVASYQPAMPSRLTTPSRRRVASNRAATGNLVRRAAVIERARLSSTMTPASQREAERLQAELSAQIDLEATRAADANDVDAYRALTDMRAEVVRDLSTRGALLSPVQERSFGRPLPALVVSQRLYQDAGRSDELTARAGALHPGFLPLTMETLIR
jgi:prophage DNA circulation protein